MKYLVSLLIISTIGGQLLRLPYLQGTGILISDFILGCIGIFWLYQLITKQSKIRFNKINLALIIFIIFTLVSLLFNIYTLPSYDSLISLFYYLRLFAYLSLFFIVQDFPKQKSKVFNLTIGTTLAIALLGFLQLKFFPNFEVLRMQEEGWDPHIGRMLSTWFDPNFLGGFFVFVLSLLSGVIVVKFNKSKSFLNFLHSKKNLILTSLFFLFSLSLVLTYSRSSYLAFLTAMFLLTLIASRKLLLIGAIFVVLLFSVSDRMQTRVVDAYESAQSIFNPYSVDTLDATARFRLESWKDGFALFNEKPFIGHGFNTLRYIQAKRGLTEWKSHNAGGIDASLLTLLVTTGSLGLILFLSFIFQLLKKVYLNYKQESDVLIQGLNLGYFCGIIGLLVHSLFVNSLLFPFIMIFVWIFGGILSRQN